MLLLCDNFQGQGKFEEYNPMRARYYIPHGLARRQGVVTLQGL